MGALIAKIGVLTGALGAILVLTSLLLKMTIVFSLGVILCLLSYICWLIKIFREE